MEKMIKLLLFAILLYLVALIIIPFVIALMFHHYIFIWIGVCVWIMAFALYCCVKIGDDS